MDTVEVNLVLKVYLIKIELQMDVLNIITLFQMHVYDTQETYIIMNQ